MTPKEPPAFGPGPTIQTIPLGKMRLAPKDHRLREVDEKRVEAMAASYRRGSVQMALFLVYPYQDEFCVYGGCTSWSGFRESHDDATPTIAIVTPTNDVRELLRWALRADNTVELPPAVKCVALRRMRPLYATQAEMAEDLGIPAPYLSELLNWEEVKDRKEARKAQIRSVIESSFLYNAVAPSPSDGQPAPEARFPSPSNLPPNGSMTPVSSLPGEAPSPASSSKDASGGDSGPSKSASHPSPSHAIIPAPPSFLSPHVPPPPNESLETLRALQVLERRLIPRAHARDSRDAVTALATQADALAMKLLDFARDLREEAWGDHPRPRAHRFPEKESPMVRIAPNGAHPETIAVLENGKRVIYPVLELTSSGVRVKDGPKVRFFANDKIVSAPKAVRA